MYESYYFHKKYNLAGLKNGIKLKEEVRLQDEISIN